MKKFKIYINMKFLICIIVFLSGGLLNTFTLNGQSAKIEDILSIRLSDAGPLLEGQEVRGYYFIYETESANKEMKSYDLRIHDVNLNLLKKKKITVPKTNIIQTVLYNGRSICLKFFDSKEDNYVFKAYDLLGEPLFTKDTDKISRMESYKSTTASEEYPSFYSIPHFGYINYTLTKEKGEKHGYNINLYSDNESTPHWIYNSQSDQIEVAMHLAADSNFAYFNIMKRDAVLSQDVEGYVMALSSKTGKQAFEVPLKNKGYKYLAFSSFIGPTGNLHMVGRYYNEADKVLKSKGLGLAMLEIDPTGKFVNTVLIPSNDKLLLNSGLVEQDEKADKSKYFFFHDFISLDDGRILGIGESYSLKINVLGLAAMAAAGGGQGSTQDLAIEDMYVFEFDKSFNLKSIQRFNKYKSNFPLPGMPLPFPIFYSFYVKERGGFDYEFFQKNADNTEAAIYYMDYEKRAGEANNTVLGAIFATKDGYTTDKFDLQKSADITSVFPGTFGSVVTVNYFRKLRAMDIQIVKLNY